ncbi:SRPBCC domain-containing protein [Chitinophaga nivalis]|uniref:SRPBCC domain-containing protein n=1 Tax=Chitinophaga nivalis TaxID=2991709 RepID=A0ABT3IQA4_9BACT|nr:SRPBCC domain-containing protein [Chitinophaga nivalis]MCW3464170.1 SRPBCC domain-containing protein [Chitinophaga nivalis]MCW3486140.1 SRPBCC domain-containing protein [Chitinophaga nivalis]
MYASNEANGNTSDRELHLTRLFNAPRELVYQAWTDPLHLEHWWVPEGFSINSEYISVRPGGSWRFVILGPDGGYYHHEVIFLETVSPDHLVYMHHNHNETDQCTITLLFTAQDKQTRLNMQLLFPTRAARDKVLREHATMESMNQTLDRLESLLTKIIHLHYKLK